MINLSIWELQIWGNNFNINGNISSPTINPDKPLSTNYTTAEFFDTGYATYTDRVGKTNYMSAIHIGSALKGLKQIRLPIADSSRTSDADLKAFLTADNTYFTFVAECDGTVYVLFPHALTNFTSEKGWRQVAGGKDLTLPEGETLSTLDPSYSDPNFPYYLSRLQSNQNTGSVTGVVAFSWCYALDFKKGDTVSIPTPAIKNGITNENLVVLVDCQPTAPFISSLVANGEYFSADEDDTFTVRVPEGTKSLSLEAIVLSDTWECTFSPAKQLTISSTYTIASVTVSDGTTSREYRIVIICGKTTALEDVTGTLGSSHYDGYFQNNDIAGNIAKMTDGSESTCLTVWHSVPKVGPLIFEYQLDGLTAVDTFYISTNANGGQPLLGEIKVEGKVNGSWQTVCLIYLPTDGIIEGASAIANVSLASAVRVSALRFTMGYNPAVLSSDGTSLGNDTLRIYEISARCDKVVIPSPELDKVTVNGKEARYEDGKYFIMVEKTVKQLVISAMPTDSSATVTYTPGETVTFDGRKQTLSLRVTNVLGKTRTYTLVVEPIECTQNVVSGMTPTFVISAGLYNDYPLSNLSDGNYNTRLAVYEKKAIEIEYNLNGVYDITDFIFSAYIHSTNPLTGKIVVRALIGGEWVDVGVYDSASNFTLYNGSASASYQVFSLNVRGASALRFYIEQNPNMLDRGISIWELEVMGSPTTVSLPTNVLSGITPSFVISDKLHDDFPLANITDGKLDTRAAMKSVKDIEIEFLLEGKYDLSSISLYVWADNGVSRTCTVIVRALIDGKWVDIATDDLSTGITVVSSSNVMKTISLNAKQVEGLRIYFAQNPDGTQKGQSIWEVSAIGTKSVQKEEVNIDGFQILTSATLQSNFDLNVYIPATYGVSEITFAGVTYNPDTLSVVEVDGKLYYKVSVPVSAKDAFTVFPLAVVLTNGESRATGNFRICLVSYLAKLLASDAEEVEKTLAKDIFSYIRSAIVYFNETIDEQTQEQIQYLDNLLGQMSYVETVPQSLKDATLTPPSGLGIERVAYSLDSEVAIVLVLEDGYTLNDYTFTIGNAKVEATERDGLVFLRVSAYRIKDTLKIEVKSKDGSEVIRSGEFSLAAYYASETVTQNAELQTLVERLATFSESADAYRQSLIHS